MATILEFKLPEKRREEQINKGAIISSTVNDVMLMIHHALHGETNESRPLDKKLAVQLLGELASHIKNDSRYDHMVLSLVSSEAVINRYPEMLQKAKY